MIGRLPRSTLTDTLLPYTTLVRSAPGVVGGGGNLLVIVGERPARCALVRLRVRCRAGVTAGRDPGEPLDHQVELVEVRVTDGDAAAAGPGVVVDRHREAEPVAEVTLDREGVRILGRCRAGRAAR